VERALRRARDFVAASQLPTGELPMEMTRRKSEEDPGVASLDPSAFATMYAALAMRADRSPETLAILANVRRFLDAQRIGPGLWRYWATPSRFYRIVPADTDSTSGVLTLYEREGWPTPVTRRIVEENRDRRGRFFTWITPGNVRSVNPRYWWFLARDASLARLVHFWRVSWAHRGDVDLVINVNVVRYLGDVACTRGAIAWILESVWLGEEEQRDKWYLDRSTLYLSLGRAFADGIARFGDLRPVITARVAERAAASGEIGGSPMHTAMCASALLHLGLRNEIVERAVAFLCASQDDEGAWAAGPHFYGGPKRLAWWGSRTFTTAMAFETLHLYLASDGPDAQD
jgi:hypothetical protein